VEAERLRPPARRLAERGLLDQAPAADDDPLCLSPAGRAALDRLTAARRDGLAELLAGWSPHEHPELAARLQELAHDLLADDDRILSDAQRP
jgi:DNA-binding MarR family transcriptional regulator